MEDKSYWVWLSSLPGIGSKRFSALIDHFGSAKAVFESSLPELKASRLIPAELADTISNNKSLERLNSYMKKVKDNDIDIICLSEEAYPENLKIIYDPPPVIYVRGALKEEDFLSIAVIGSRKASDYGLKTADKLSYELAQNGVTVISGMAMGIDSAAHNGALRAGGRTIAVFGCGLLHVHPKSGYALYKEIIKHGAVISEYPISYPARPEYFPARNRIVSGMSKGIVVVEAGLKSGTLITTDFALEQGRDVFAVPGNINSPGSKGTNDLIKNGAKLVDCVEDVLSELNINTSAAQKAQDPAKRADISSDEAKILNCIRDNGKNINEIVAITGMNVKNIMSVITIMEIKGLIIQTNSTYYLSI